MSICDVAAVPDDDAMQLLALGNVVIAAETERAVHEPRIFGAVFDGQEDHGYDRARLTNPLADVKPVELRRLNDEMAKVTIRGHLFIYARESTHE